MNENKLTNQKLGQRDYFHQIHINFSTNSVSVINKLNENNMKSQLSY